MSTSQNQGDSSSQDNADQDSSEDPSNDSSNGESGNGQDASDDQNGDNGQNGDQNEDESKNALEWGVTIAGALIVLSITGFLLYELFAGASGPAQLEITLGAPETAEAGIEVPVEVRNKGAQVAEVAVIEVCAGPDECAQVTFDYVPYMSKVTGTVGFEAPLPGPLSSRVVSFRDP